MKSGWEAGIRTLKTRFAKTCSRSTVRSRPLVSARIDRSHGNIVATFQRASSVQAPPTQGVGGWRFDDAISAALRRPCVSLHALHGRARAVVELSHARNAPHARRQT